MVIVYYHDDMKLIGLPIIHRYEHHDQMKEAQGLPSNVSLVDFHNVYFAHDRNTVVYLPCKNATGFSMARFNLHTLHTETT